MITIYNQGGQVLLEVQERDESRYTRTLMGEHNVRLRFDWDRAVPLPYGSYIQYMDRKWQLYANYIPTQKDGVAEYDVAFHALEIELKNFTAFYMSGGALEAEWDMTGSLEQFALEVKNNLKRINSPIKEVLVSEGVANAQQGKHVSVSKKSIADLLGSVAEAFDVEWWLEDKTIYLGKMPERTEVVARLGELAGSYTPQGEGNPLISRLYAFGSTKNLSKGYRQDATTKSRIAEARLHTPKNKPFVQGVSQGIEEVQYFDDIYPRYIGTITEVTTRRNKTDLIYKIKDRGLHITTQYIKEGQTLKVIFESGALQGMEFELRSLSDHYEIVPNESYGQMLPAGNLIPKVGDKYVPFGFDISMVDAQYVSRAEEELYQKASEWLTKNNEDRRDVELACNPVYVHNNNIKLELGQKVRLVGATPLGDKVGRVTKVEHPLYCPQLITATIGNTKPLNAMERIEERASKTATEQAKAHTNEQMRTTDQRIDEDYLHKVIKEGKTTIEGGLINTNIIGLADSSGNVRAYIDGKPENSVAFAAGVRNFAKENMDANVEIHHSGDAKFGTMYIDGATGIIKAKNSRDALPYLRIGGELTSLANLLNTSRVSGSGAIAVSTGVDTRSISEGWTALNAITLERGGATLRVQGTIKVVFNDDLSGIAIDNRDPSRQKTLAGLFEVGMSIDGYSAQTRERRGTAAWLFNSRHLAGDSDHTQTFTINEEVRGLSLGDYAPIFWWSQVGDTHSNISVTGNLTLSYESLSDTKEIAFAEGGLSLYYSHDRMFYIQRNGNPFLTIRGAVDMEGDVKINGLPVNQYGLIAFGEVTADGRIVRSTSVNGKAISVTMSGNRYIITHNLGHLDYTLHILAKGTKDVPTYYDISSNAITIGMRAVGNDRDYRQQFIFTLMGKLK